MSDYMQQRRPRRHTLETILARVNMNGPIPDERPDLGPCWVWTKYIQNGYGMVGYGKRIWRVHRIVYHLMVAVVPEELTLDHLCRNRACCNPKHLEPVTNRENWLRGESLTRRNSKKTHCPAGHPYTESNTYLVPGRRRSRFCIECRRQQSKRDWERIKANVASL